MIKDVKEEKGLLKISESAISIEISRILRTDDLDTLTDNWESAPLHSGRTRADVTMTLVKREMRSFAGERVRINYTSDCRVCNLVAFVRRKFASN